MGLFGKAEGKDVRPAVRTAIAACGLACAQAWLPLVAALAAAYREGGADIGFVMTPLWVGYALGALAMLAVEAVRQAKGRAGGGFPAFSDGIALGATLVGLMVTIVSHSMSEVLAAGVMWPIGISAFAGCALAAAGSVRLSLSWVGRLPGAADRDGFGGEIAFWLLVAAVLCCLIPVAGALGHSVWAPLLNAGLVALSFAGLTFTSAGAVGREGRPEPDAAEVAMRAESGISEGEALPFGTARTPLVRVAAAGVVLGLVFAVMIGQFVGARFGRALPATWVFGIVGVVLVAAVQSAVRRMRGFWDTTPACWAVAAAMVVAFYPIDAGSDFSLKFALAGSTCALWMLAAAFPPAVTACVPALPREAWTSSPTRLFHTVAGLAFGCGAAIGGPVGFVLAGTPVQGQFVFASAIVSMIASFVALAWLVRPAAATVRPDVAGAPGGGEADAVAGLSTEERCAQIARAYGLTPRELDVLRVLARGYDVARVQEELGVSEGTALTHKRHIYQKLGVHSRAELLDKVGM